MNLMKRGTIILYASLSMLVMPGMTLARKALPLAKEFEVKYDKGPYEKVMTADQYRNELLKTGKEEKALKDIYFDRASELYEAALLEDETFIYGQTSLGFLYLWASIDPYLSKREVLRQAKGRFINAIRLGRSHYEAYYYLAVADTLEKDWDSALNNLREYIRSERDDSYYHLLLGYIYASGKGEITTKAKVEFELAKERAADPISVQWAIRQLKKPQKPDEIPPIKPPTPPRKEYFPRSVSMSIYVPTFTDKTEQEEIRKIPELLSSRIRETIFRNNRFILVEKRATEKEGEYPAGVDSVLIGSIINVDLMGKTLLCHVKLVYPEGGNILFSKDSEIPYTDKPMLAISDRDINRIVGEIEKNFIKSEANIIHLSKNYVTVNLGNENGIRPGFKGLVIGKTSQIVIPRTKEVITNEIYLGEILFEQIEERVSKARILSPGRVTIQVGDLVRTK
jgi:tetratricopeptide (TPR) repeat protein